MKIYENYFQELRVMKIGCEKGVFWVLIQGDME